MSAAVQAFQTQYKVSYIPSRIKLCKYVAHYQNNDFDRDSLAYLNQVWPRLGWITPTGPNGALRARRIDWDGTNGGGGDNIDPNSVPASNASNTFVLDGGQCLVFFLGGIPETSIPGTKGFWTNPANPTVNPANANAPTERVPVFYEFKSNRLIVITPALPNVSLSHYFYRDVYGKRPYAYFSSYGRTNGYNKYAATLGSDCAAVDRPSPPRQDNGYDRIVWPLAEQLGASPRFLNPDTFQIISAGANEAFGPGSGPPGNALWSYRNPGPAYGGTQPGSDDQCNFHSLVLGAAAE